MAVQKIYRFGDFPELFWDAKPEEPIDPANPVVLGRILTRGSMEAIRKLVTLKLLRSRLGEIVVPEHVREFWKLVLQHVPDSRRKAGA